MINLLMEYCVLDWLDFVDKNVMKLIYKIGFIKNCSRSTGLNETRKHTALDLCRAIKSLHKKKRGLSFIPSMQRNLFADAINVIRSTGVRRVHSNKISILFSSIHGHRNHLWLKSIARLIYWLFIWLVVYLIW